MCEFENKPLPAKQPPVHRYTVQELQQAADAINKSQRPVIYFGGGVAISNAGDELLALMKKASITACHSMMGTGVLCYDEPMNLGMVGMHGRASSSLAIEQCDLLIAIGARFSDRVATNLSLIHICQMDKPDVDSIDGLSPAISIDQKTTSRNPRSTVRTVTEVHDYLRLLYARIGQPHCPKCGRPIQQPVSYTHLDVYKRQIGTRRRCEW